MVYIHILQTTLEEDNFDIDTLEFLFEDQPNDFAQELERQRKIRQKNYL